MPVLGNAGNACADPRARLRRERAAGDDRNFVKKGVSWALRVAGRRNRELNDAAIETARRLIESPAPAAPVIVAQVRMSLANSAPVW